MATPFLGEVRIVSFNFAPKGWAMCNGQLLPINQNQALFSILGTTYGGDGRVNFALPDLRGRVPLHFGSGFTLAETGGVEEVTLTLNQIPAHTHAFLATTNAASSTIPANQVPAITQAATITPYGTDAPLVQLSPSSVGSAGGSQPHNNFQPYLCIEFIISLFGIFPSQS